MLSVCLELTHVNLWTSQFVSAGAEDQPLIKGVEQTDDALTCAAMLLLSVEESHLNIITLVIQQYPSRYGAFVITLETLA
jgi:hypothetical protein